MILLTVVVYELSIMIPKYCDIINIGYIWNNDIASKVNDRVKETMYIIYYSCGLDRRFLWKEIMKRF